VFLGDEQFVESNLARNEVENRVLEIPRQQRAELTQLSHTIAHRVSRFLERQGLLVRDDDDCIYAGGRATQGAVAETTYLDMDSDDNDPMATLIGRSVTYRIATGPRRDRKVLTLQTLPASDEPFTTRVGNVATSRVTSTALSTVFTLPTFSASLKNALRSAIAYSMELSS
jgi:hypothetical protein